jgi:hypothetical protein
MHRPGTEQVQSLNPEARGSPASFTGTDPLNSRPALSNEGAKVIDDGISQRLDVV